MYQCKFNHTTFILDARICGSYMIFFFSPYICKIWSSVYITSDLLQILFYFFTWMPWAEDCKDLVKCWIFAGDTSPRSTCLLTRRLGTGSTVQVPCWMCSVSVLKSGWALVASNSSFLCTLSLKIYHKIKIAKNRSKVYYDG